MEAAHGRRLLHRDLKPENIFLTRTGTMEVAKILDFGVAKAIAPKQEEPTATLYDTAPGMLVGTVRYMAPEQFRGGEPAESWDLWALAVIAYEMFPGAYPFSMTAATGAGLAFHVTPVRAHVPTAAASWEAFFQRSLAVDRAVRPASASNFHAELQRLQYS